MSKTTKTAETTAAAKSQSKKTATATKPAAKPAAEKTPTQRDPNALRKPQLRLLEALTKAKGPLNRHALNEKAGVDLAWVNEFAGKLDAAKRAAADEKYQVKSLVTRGYAKVREIDVEGKKETVWEITAAGKSALLKAQKA